MEFALIIVAFFVVAFVIGTLWSRTESYKENQRFKRILRQPKRGVSPIIED